MKKIIAIFFCTISLTASAADTRNLNCTTTLKSGREISVKFSPFLLLGVANDSKLYSDSILKVEKKLNPEVEGGFFYSSDDLIIEMKNGHHIAWLKVEANPIIHLGIDCKIVDE